MPIRPENRARYPSDWPEISATIRFKRARSRCECRGECGQLHGRLRGDRCEARHSHAHPRTGSTVVLTVAHLDHCPENCDPTNLRAMCQACHLSYDAAHHAETARATRAAALAKQMEPMF